METLISKKEFARRLGVSTRTIDRWRAWGKNIGEVKLGKIVRFKISAVERLTLKGLK